MNNDELLLKGDGLFELGLHEEAFAIFLKAANEGGVHAMLRLASMHTCDEGVACNYDKAIEWELRAAESGEIIALLNLGISYRIKGDIIKAKHWFEKSVAAGDGNGALQLAKLYMVSDKERENVIKYLRIALASNEMCDADIEEAKQFLREI